MKRLAIPRCPKCNSATVRKREMIVKTSTYDRVGGSIGLSSKLWPRVFVSRGRNNWAKELKPMSYFWPGLMALFLWGSFQETEQSFSLASWIAVIINVLWFIAVLYDHKGYREEWACSKCGEVWNPSESKESTAAGNKSTELRGT